MRLYDSGYPEKPRFGEYGKLLPVGMVVTVVLSLYILYVVVHGLRLLQLDLPSYARDADEVNRAMRELGLFHAVTALLLYCLVRCVLTAPGAIPDGAGWELSPDSGSSVEGTFMKETKDSGERRHCKWCLKYKPDRCHHCRVCNTCVLRMDHHCPWVYNCIGFKNHKYFFLLIFYTVLDLFLITITMFDSVWWATRSDVPLPTMTVMLVGEVGACFLLVLGSTFFTFHVWLMLKAMTTIEFCEKSKKDSYDSSLYSRGAYRNVCAVLGPRPLLWLLPVSLPAGDGVTWPGPGTRGGPPTQAPPASAPAINNPVAAAIASAGVQARSAASLQQPLRSSNAAQIFAAPSVATPGANAPSVAAGAAAAPAPAAPAAPAPAAPASPIPAAIAAAAAVADAADAAAVPIVAAPSAAAPQEGAGAPESGQPA